MRPLLKLKFLLLSKLLWDARQSPGHVASFDFHTPWPAKALHRAVKQLCSPCVAGDLLRQRAPALVPHFHSFQKLSQGRNGLDVHKSDYVRGLSAVQLASCFSRISAYLDTAAATGLNVIGVHP
jgi:hypothetical protein